MIDTFEFRCRIIELALSGQLSVHCNGDGDVSQMLKDINHKKDIAVTDNVPYEIPSTWKWVKLSDLYKINPKVEADGAKEAAFIPMERISAGFSREFSYEIKTWDKASKNHTKFADGDVAFAKISPCFENRKSFIAEQLPNGIGGGTTELIILRQRAMDPLFTYYVVNDKRFIKNGSSSYKGIVGQQRVKSNVVKNYLVPVPPIEEQKRIVERVDEIFKLLDKIDTLQGQYQNNVEVLKSKIIDAGIRGQLTEQLPEDGTAEELYQQIQAEKAQLIKEKKIKKEKPMPEITAAEIPFEIPGNWKWVRLGEIGNIQTGATPPKSHLEFFGNYIPFVSPGDMITDIIQKVKQGLSETGSQHGRIVEGKTVLQVCIGGSIGKTAICETPITFNQQINSITPYFVSERFVYYVLVSSYFYKRVHEKATGAATPIINKSSWGNILFPLPPLSEQKRIVAKIDSVLGAIGK